MNRRGGRKDWLLKKQVISDASIKEFRDTSDPLHTIRVQFTGTSALRSAPHIREIVMPGVPNAKIAVIGGGPKGVALAVKAKVAAEIKIGHIAVEIFEPNRIGAHWSGEHGYTDGQQELCTPAERDLGFPYASTLEAKRIPRQRQSGRLADLMTVKKNAEREKEATSLNRELDKRLYSEYSWATHLLAVRTRYGDWLNAGRRAPTHQAFAEYLRWAVDKSRSTVHFERVTALIPKGKKWTVRTSDNSGKQCDHSGFDGVVVTGPGNSRVVEHPGGAVSRVFNGQNLWQNADEVRRLLAPKDSSVVVIGGGGTGAAVIAWLVREGFAKRPIHLIAQQATLYMRSDNVFDNRLFSDDGLWNALKPATQDAFFNRLNRGVVWAKSLHEIEQASGLDFRDGKATSIRVSGIDELEVRVSKSTSSATVKGTIVIDASGFNSWWFTSLLPKSVQTHAWTKRDRAALQTGMSESLAFDHPTLWKKLPPLHVPGLSERRGPGLASLMTLGTMSDRILRAYLPQT
jgi:mycobactin lysine-N-oxygenase